MIDCSRRGPASRRAISCRRCHACRHCLHAQATAFEPKAGALIGPYRLISELGHGGMGAVWLAERADGTLKRQVALKLPHLAWARDLAERMARERDILATLEHPNIARLYDAGVDRVGRPWLAMEHVQGRTIDVLPRARRSTCGHGWTCCFRSCSAVAYAHSRLVIHRDLKPSNILVTPRRPGAPARFRHRQADGGRPHLRDRADASRRARPDAGLRQPGADPW